jgi:alpha/beta superfamily hydrolase
MRRIVLLVGLLAAGAASAGERRVEIDVPGGPVVGTLESPEGATPAVAVLLLHGFTDSRDGLAVAETDEGVFSRTARILAENGVASLRIDFRGSGDSGGEWRDTTFSGQIADAVAAYDWLRSQEGIDPGRTAALGWSQGGLVAAHLAAERPDLAALVLWAPVQNALWNFSGFLGVETTMTALGAPPDQEITVPLPGGDESTLRAAFWQEMALTHPVAAAALYAGPLMVIVGARDEVVTPQPSGGEVFLRYHPGPEELVVLDTDHAFDVMTGPEVLDGMIDRSLAWIQAATK